MSTVRGATSRRTFGQAPLNEWLHRLDEVPRHRDISGAETIAELDAVHRRVLALGGRLRLDRSDDPEETVRVYADRHEGTPRPPGSEDRQCPSRRGEVTLGVGDAPGSEDQVTRAGLVLGVPDGEDVPALEDVEQFVLPFVQVQGRVQFSEVTVVSRARVAVSRLRHGRSVRGDGMSVLEHVALATARLLATVHGLADDELYEPSLLPGWNRAHVLTHLTHNADGHIRMLSGARVGELRPQYPSRQARSDAIEAGAGRPRQAVVEDLERSCAAWAGAAANMPSGAWDADVQPLGRAPRTARQLQWARLREVEVHHVDLASTYGSGDWSLEFAVQLLEEICTTFAVRGDKPCVRVVATDYGYSCTTGPSPPIEVHGPVRSLAAWLAGRHLGDDLATRSDVPLPIPPGWA